MVPRLPIPVAGSPVLALTPVHPSSRPDSRRPHTTLLPPTRHRSTTPVLMHPMALHRPLHAAVQWWCISLYVNASPTADATTPASSHDYTGLYFDSVLGPSCFSTSHEQLCCTRNSGTDWIFDSGASRHMSASSNLLSSCTPLSFPSITLGDGSSIPIYCIGQAQIQSPIKPLLLHDVLVAPALIKNLTSVRQITTDNHVSVEFDPFGLSVKDYPTKAEIARFNSFSDLYSLHGAPVAAPPTSMVASVDLWHQCLGHPNKNV